MMDNESLSAVLESVLQRAAADGESPSAAVLTRLTELAASSDIQGFAETYRAFAHAKPSNAAFVRASLPAKILNGYISRQPGVTTEKAKAWFAADPGWSDQLKDAAESAVMLEAFVKRLVIGIQAS